MGIRGLAPEVTLLAPAGFQVHPEGKFVVDVDKNIDINDVSVLGPWQGRRRRRRWRCLPQPWPAWLCLHPALPWGC